MSSLSLSPLRADLLNAVPPRKTNLSLSREMADRRYEIAKLFCTWSPGDVGPVLQ